MYTMIAGIIAFLYCSSQLGGLDPVPEGTDLGEYLRYEAGKFELGRYVGLVVGFVGIVLSLFPKGR